MEEDFAQWYTDVVKKAELIDYSSVKGCMIIKPAGYAIWENIHKELDRRFKETGVENVYMPLFIPESLLEKEKDHVEGFAPEVAWVTHGGLQPLQMLDVYADFLENELAIPVIKGQKTEKEKFAGAEATYTIEALMHDGKALQSGTSHNFGDGFAKAFDITYTDKNNQLVHPFQTSWGMTTRLIACISRKRSCRMPWDALLISRAFYRIIHVIRMAEHCISNLKLRITCFCGTIAVFGSVFPMENVC